MAVLARVQCAGCHKPIGTTDSCTDTAYPYVVDGQVRWLKPIPYGQESWDEIGLTPPERCHDCGVVAGRIHHWHCDVADCPNFGQQLLGCDCDMRSEAEIEAAA